MNVAKIVINLSLDRTFDYRIPRHLQGRVRVGSRVRVPFGKGDGTRTGHVVSLAPSSDFPGLKDILAIEGDREQIPESLVRLAEWISRYYCCAKEQAVRAMLPAVVRRGKMRQKRRKFVRPNNEKDLASEFQGLQRRAPKQAAVLQAVLRLGPSTLSTVLRDAGANRDAAKRLAEKDLIVIEERTVERDPFGDDIILPTKHLRLTGAQDGALRAVNETLDAHRREVFLLYGVTGSGKTEVYLQAIDKCLELGHEAIVLVPEISLTPQTMERFRSRFGETVSVLHSGLSDGERFDEWTKIHEGRTRIAIGARSALFAPFRNLGLIVVDEEHETTYKQEEAPRYHARDVAVVRGQLENATVILGSATPSLESYHNCKREKYRWLELPERVDNRLMPHMEVVDMRAEAALRGGAQVFSRRLQDMMRDRLDKGEQTILFLNRRGYATQMLCTECGYVANCQECSVAYTYHRHDHRLLCHLCGAALPAPSRCPQCNDDKIRYSGLGTEKVEALAHRFFPHAAIARMDSDTMTAKDAHKNTLNAFRTGRIHILIGTQMIAKGLDFPNVTLVGVIFADLALHLPDFRAGERTFQLLTQVAGRAGRGEIPGRVIVQSYTPFHPALQHGLEKNYHGFADEELSIRSALRFPPVTRAVLVHFRGENSARVARRAEEFAEVLRNNIGSPVEMGRPTPAPIARVRNKFRYHLLIRTDHIRSLVETLRDMVLGGGQREDVDIFVDVDPQGLL